MHTLLDLYGSIPTFIYLTEAAIHDSKTMSLIPVEPESYYLIDKGYVDFKQLFNHFHHQQALFVTRAKHLASAHCIVRLDEVNDVVRHLIVTSPWDVLHLVVDDDWCDIMLLLEDFGCLGGEGCRGVGARDGDNGFWWNE